MRIFPILKCFLLAALLLAGGSTAALGHSAAGDMAEAANSFLSSLTPEQRAKAVYEFKHAERENFHFIPRSRNGLPLKQMTPAQRHLAYALLNSAMSNRGFVKTTTIMSLEQVLHDMENNAPHRDPELYFFTIFGTPGDKQTWGWRVEGHHLSLNFTIANGTDVAVTPSFMGTNPAEVRTGPRKGLRVLAQEEDLGRKLVQSLNEEQRKIAIYTNVAPSDVITAANRQISPLKPDGLPTGKMTREQSAALLELLKEYVYRYRAEVADRDLEKIQKAGWDKVYFAWAGSTEPKQGHYYRIQGPTFLMEYDNTQNDANHIHAVWRDFQNDFGDDLLRKHYQTDHH